MSESRQRQRDHPQAAVPHLTPEPPAPSAVVSGDRLFGTVPIFAALAATALVLPWLVQLPPLQGALCLLQVSIAAAGIARAAYPTPRLVALVTFVFTFSWVGVAPIYQLATGTAAWRDSAILRSSSTIPALILLVLATGVLYIGFFRAGTGGPPKATVWTDISPPRSVCIAYVVACCLLTPGAVSASGGLANMFSNRAVRAEALGSQGLVLSEVGGLQVALVGVLPGALATAGAYLVLIRLLNQYRRDRWADIKAADAGLFAIALSLVVVFANPFVNTRALSAAALGSLVLLILRPRSRKAGFVMAASLLTATLVAYPAAGAFGGATRGESHGLEFLAGQDFDGFQQTVNAVDFVDDLGHSFGTYTVSGALYFIPRAVWADKERPASIDIASHRGYVFTNLSLPVQAEMYVDFGPVGMAVAMFLLATAGRRCDLDWAAGVSSRAALLAPYACLACLSVIRGPIGSNGPVYLTNLGLIALGLLLARIPLPRTGSPQPRVDP